MYMTTWRVVAPHEHNPCGETPSRFVCKPTEIKNCVVLGMLQAGKLEIVHSLNRRMHHRDIAIDVAHVRPSSGNRATEHIAYQKHQGAGHKQIAMKAVDHRWGVLKTIFAILRSGPTRVAKRLAA